MVLLSIIVSNIYVILVLQNSVELQYSVWQLIILFICFFFIPVKVAVIRCKNSIKRAAEIYEKTTEELDKKVGLHITVYDHFVQLL